MSLVSFVMNASFSKTSPLLEMWCAYSEVCLQVVDMKAKLLSTRHCAIIMKGGFQFGKGMRDSENESTDTGF